MEKRDGLGEMIGDIIGEVIGYAFCMSMMVGLYFIGVALAQWLGATEHRVPFGLLSAFTMVWTYEHRRANDRWTRHFNQ